MLMWNPITWVKNFFKERKRKKALAAKLKKLKDQDPFIYE